MKTFLLICSIATALPDTCPADEAVKERLEAIQKEGTQKGKLRLVVIREDLEVLERGADDELLVRLGRHLHFLSSDDYRLRELQEEAAPLRTKVRNALLRTPGHAEAQERRFLSLRAEVLAGKRTWNDLHFAGVELHRALRHLPSPETMRVLGKMLEDTKGATAETHFPNQPTDAINVPKSAAEYAMIALHYLPIQQPPVPRNKVVEGEVLSGGLQHHQAWLQWWMEVKDGVRTYRIEGSPVVYNHDGANPGGK
ncbi:MAG: hypothetical protein EOP87_12080 [Verrucomicrobiaceae bacterium]|nr:MAG: hypothetical protein EOP87_12080 [Verrucomicrobiaceae bacterium]